MVSMKFSVTVLGSGAAIPVSERNPSAHLVEVRNRLLLLDCAEGTQLKLRKFIARPLRISHIFISHLHGDHYFGLIGLLTTFHLLGRKNELHLHGIEPLMEIIDLQLLHSRTSLIYPLTFHPFEAEKSAIIVDDDQFSVSTIPLDHRVPTCGFLVKEKPFRRKIRKEFAARADVPVTEFEKIKDGADYIDASGMILKNSDITSDPPPSRSYAYCTDTAYYEAIIPVIAGTDLLYHEATFMQDKVYDAHEKYHSTAKEAATIALKAGVKRLMLGHYSARYKELGTLLEEARAVFPDTILAEDGKSIEL